MALVVAGSLGLGPVKEAVHALVRLPGWRPVAACGKNEKLREEVGSIPGADAIGWTDDMATVMADADVVIDNAARLAGALQRASSSESRRERVTAGRALFGTDPAELLVKWFSDRAGTWEA